MPDTRQTFLVRLVNGHRYLGLALANDAKPATCWGTRITFARAEWTQDTTHTPWCPLDLRYFARGVPPPARQAISGRGPTRSVKQTSTPQLPTATLC